MTHSAKMQTAVSAADEELDSAVITYARQGDPAAWDSLVRDHQQPAFRLAYLITGDAADAEEIAQDAFMRAYDSLQSFDETRPFKPWLLQIVRNLARNRRRSAGRYWHHLMRWWQQQPEPVIQPVHLAQAEAQELWQAVRRLKPAWQEVLYLRYFLELSEAQTAETLAISPGTVKSRLHRALNALRAIIEQEHVE